MAQSKSTWTIIFWTVIQAILAADDDLMDYSALFGVSPRQDLNFTELVKYDGYKVESHPVTTSDGYILGVYRIPIGENCSGTDNIPIIFWHGLYISGDDCIIPGPGKAHCYVYADACYDVWVPNSRGNRYSRQHVTLNPDTDSSFWKFSFDEMALLDLPVVIDYILKTTGKTQVSYIGHAQGVTLLLLLCAQKPEYNNKIKIGFGLSTTAWLDHSKFLIIGLQGILEPLLTSANNVGIDAEIFKNGGVSQKTAKLLCGSSNISYPFCSVAVFALFGYNRFQITSDVLSVVVGHTPAGTSLRNFNRWGQVKNNGFSKWDYGSIQNLINYGSIKPPLFDLSNVTMKWIFIGSENDNVGDLKDLDTLIDHLPNSNTTKCVLSDTTFADLDFVYGKDIPNYITPTVLAYLSNGTYVCI